MDIIDDRGNLFGVVNIIDVLVVLMIVSVGVAGIALVFGGEESPEPEVETTGVTLDLGSVPALVVEEINEGDQYSPGGESSLTITDVQLAPGDGGARVILRVLVEGEVRSGDGGINYAGSPLRLGRSLDIATNRYQESGRIREVSSGDSLDRQQTTVLLRDTLPEIDAEAISPGDEIRLAGRTIATVEETSFHPTGDITQTQVFLKVNLETYRQQGERRFGASPVRRGQTIQLDGDGYSIQGSIERVGADADLASQDVDVVIIDSVNSETASRIVKGDVSRTAGRTVGTIESVSIFGTNDPDQKRIVAGVSVNTVNYAKRPLSGRGFIQRGANLTFQTETYQLSGQIDRVGTAEPSGTPATREVTLRMDDTRENMAETITPGLSEEASGDTIARVTAVETEPSVLILRGERANLEVADHPFNKDVTITAELQVRETTGGVRFKGESLRQGQTVTLDLGVVTIEAVVVGIG